MEVPPPFTNLQASRGGGGGGKTWQEEPGGEGGVLGLWGQIFGTLGISFSTRSLFSSLVCQGLVGQAYVPAFGRDEWEEAIWRK